MRFLVKIPIGEGDVLKLYVIFNLNANSLDDDFDLIVMENLKFQKRLTDLRDCPLKMFDERNHRSLFHVLCHLKHECMEMNHLFYRQMSKTYDETAKALSDYVATMESSITNGKMKYLVKLDLNGHFHFAFPGCDETLIELYCTFEKDLFSPCPGNNVVFWPSHALQTLLDSEPIMRFPEFDPKNSSVEKFLPNVAVLVRNACTSRQTMLEHRRFFMSFLAEVLKQSFIYCDFETYLEAQVCTSIEDICVLVNIKLSPTSLEIPPTVLVQALNSGKDTVFFERQCPIPEKFFVAVDSCLVKYFCDVHLGLIRDEVLASKL